MKISPRRGWAGIIISGGCGGPGGAPEELVTGNGGDWEKFQKWAGVLELAAGSPLYHWSHLELRRYFGYGGVLNERTAEEVWALTREKLKEPSMGARGLIRQSGVKVLCTTDDPADPLECTAGWQRIRAFLYRSFRPGDRTGP